MKTLVLLFAMFLADISGKWTFEVVLDDGGGSPTFDLTQTGETLTGMYHGQLGDAKVTGTVKGDKVELAFDGATGNVKYSGTIVDAKSMKGTVDYGEVGKGTFTAKKN